MIQILWVTARPETFKTTSKDWLDKALFKEDIKIHVAVDSEEHRAQLSDYDVSVVNNPRHGITTPLYHLTSNLEADDNDIIVVASDDFFPPEQWDRYLNDVFNEWDGAIWANDGYGYKIISIPIMTFGCLKKLNRIIYHPIYNHLFSDQETWDTLHDMELVKDCRKDSEQFEHRHPLHIGTEGDEVNEAVNVGFYDNKSLYESRFPLPTESKLKVKKLSILICSLEDRAESRNKLVDGLNFQLTDDVEICVNIDDGSKVIGQKRNELIRDSIGEYIVFIDDDDYVSDDYVSEILKAIESAPDVVGIKVIMTTNGQNPETGICSIKVREWSDSIDPRDFNRKVYLRTPHHLCPVKRIIALKAPFPELSFGEDKAYSDAIRQYLETEVFIDKNLYFYKYTWKPAQEKPVPKFKIGKYYSQIGQDRFVRNYLAKEKATGVFIEVGAFDGVRFSNSLHFEESGWTGVCVEPNPEIFKLLIENRKCQCEDLCIWKESGIIEFRTVEGDPDDDECKMLPGIASAMDCRHIKRLNEASEGGKVVTIKMPAITLNDLLDKHNLTHVDYCSLDTEGSELEILKAFDFDKYTVDVFSVENNYNDETIREFMRSKGYKCHKIQWDDIYSRNV